MTIPFFDAFAVAKALPYSRLIDHMTTALAKPAAMPMRSCVSLSGRRELMVMPASSDRYSGVKILSIGPEGDASSGPTISGLFVMLNTVTGRVLATMDAGELTARRTAAVSALASVRLSREDATTLLVLGTGHLVPHLAEAHCTVRKIEQVRIWGRDHKKARRCRDSVRDRLPGLDVQAVIDLAEAVASSDVVSAATRSCDPVITGAWLRPGTHIDLVGGYRPHMREMDDPGIALGRIFVDTLEGALAEAGDLVIPIQAGVITREAIVSELAGLARGAAGRNSREEITIFKSVGSAVSDLAAAELVWERAGG